MFVIRQLQITILNKINKNSIKNLIKSLKICKNNY